MLTQTGEQRRPVSGKDRLDKELVLVDQSQICQCQGEGHATDQRGAYRGCKPSLDAKTAAELCEKAAADVPKAALARHCGISRETVYAYLRAEV